MKKAKIIVNVVGVFFFVTVVLGFSYAMYRKTLYNVNVVGNSKNLDEYVVYSKGVNISGNTLIPVNSYTNGISTTITFYRKSTSPYNLYGHIYMDINDMEEPLSYELKYAVIDNSTGNLASEGSFYTYVTGSSLPALYNIPLNSTNTTYTIYVWLDENLYNMNTYASNFDIDIRCNVTMNPIEENSTVSLVPEEDNAVNYVKNLYSRSFKKTVHIGNSNPTYYNLSPSVNLMNDRFGGITESLDGGNIRYYGANPNNYVWLGDTFIDTYSYRNYNLVTRNIGEKKLWRIVGVFDGRLKLISNDPISLTKLSWDTSESTINSGKGVNEWSQADLMKLLNPGFEDNKDLSNSGNTITVNNSLYWNKETGTVYTGQSNTTTSDVSFSNTGLSTVERNLIDIATWYLGALQLSDSGYLINSLYASERQSNRLGKTCSSGNYCNDNVVRMATWNGKVGLIYPSDYGYASDLTFCSGIVSSSRANRNCSNSNWIPGSQDLITPVLYNNDASNASSIVSSDFYTIGRLIASYSTYYTYPSIYLKSNVVITAGNGTVDNPYVLSLE